MHQQHLLALASDDRAGGEHVPWRAAWPLVSHHSVTERRTRAQPVVGGRRGRDPGRGSLAGGVLWWQDADTTEFEQAVGLAPAGRRAAGLDRLASGPLRARRRPLGLVVQRPGGRVPRRGLRRRPDLRRRRCWHRPRSSTSGSASPPPPSTGSCSASRPRAPLVTLRLPESTDFDELADGLEELGYTRPDDEDGVWRGGSDLLAGIGPDLTPELQHVALDADERLVRTSDTAAYLAAPRSRTPASRTRPSTRWSRRRASRCPPPCTPAPRLPGAGDVAGRRRRPGRRPTSWSRTAGEVNPLTAFAMSAQPAAAYAWCWPSRTTTRPGPMPTPARCWPAARRPGRAATSRDRFRGRTGHRRG